MKAFLAAIFDVIEVAFVAVLAVVAIRTFLVQPFLVSGASMQPTFEHGDYLLVDELSYRFRTPQRGEVIVFRYPGDESVYYIKRIIGLPGERVTIKNGAITIYNAAHEEGIAVDEAYLARGSKSMKGKDIDTTLGGNDFFVMGDNRLQSFDSRDWGAVKRNEVVGLVRLRLWPLEKVMAFESPLFLH